MLRRVAEVILEIDGVIKRFEDFTAVDGVSFKVHAGETVGLLGVNGAGKTTLMNMILGLTTPSGGAIRAFGMDLQKHRLEILQRSNFCTTYATLPGNLKVRANLEIFARLYSVAKPKQKVAELLELLEITKLAEKSTGQLSAGESTRVNLAKALLNDPDLLLLDEPTASLDPDIADKVRKLVRHVQRPVTRRSSIRPTTCGTSRKSATVCFSSTRGRFWRRERRARSRSTSKRTIWRTFSSRSPARET